MTSVGRFRPIPHILCLSSRGVKHAGHRRRSQREWHVSATSFSGAVSIDVASVAAPVSGM